MRTTLDPRLRRRICFSLSLLAGFLFTGCVMNRLDPTPRTIELEGRTRGQPVTVTVTKGPHWSRPMKAGPFVFNVLPQIVVWTEDQQGRLIETLYITGASGKGLNHAAKMRKGAAFYAECLPVWASRMTAAGASLPSKEEPYTDATTSATPMTSFAVRTSMRPSVEPFAVLVEINQSSDVNATYTESNNGWAGQPSVIYRAVIADPRADRGTHGLSVIGHGGRLTDAPAVYPDLSGLDTALDQVSEIAVSLD